MQYYFLAFLYSIKSVPKACASRLDKNTMRAREVVGHADGRTVEVHVDLFRVASTSIPEQKRLYKSRILIDMTSQQSRVVACRKRMSS